MKNITLLSVLLITNLSIAQSLKIEWQKTFGGSGADSFSSGKATSDGGMIMAGRTVSTNGDITNNHGLDDAWIVKLSESGTPEWQKTYGGSGGDLARSIQQTPDGGYIFAGSTNSNDGDVTGVHGNFSDCWIVKISQNGTLEWQRTYGGSHYEYANSIGLTSDGGYIIAAETYSNDGDVSGLHGTNGKPDFWILKLDNLGNMVWKKTYGGSDNEVPRKIMQTLDGGYIAIGEGFSTDGDLFMSHGGDWADAWVIKLDSSGNMQWQKTYGSSGYEIPYDIEQLSDGSYIFTSDASVNDGDITGLHGENDDLWVVKITEMGAIEWQKTLGGSSHELAPKIEITPDSGYLITGLAISNDGDLTENFGGSDIWVVKLDQQANIEWQKSFGGSDDETPNFLEKMNDGRFFIGAHTKSNNGDVTLNQGEYDAWVLKLEPEILSTNDLTKDKILISPNPANTNLDIRLNAPIDSISITDISGKKVFQQNGDHHSLNIEKLSSGMYILEVYTAGQKFQTKFIKQ